MAGRKPRLSKSERACLEAIASSERALGLDRHSIVTSIPCCGENILERLRSLGLIEFATPLWMPLEMKREVVRVTPAGKALLSTSD